LHRRKSLNEQMIAPSSFESRPLDYEMEEAQSRNPLENKQLMSTQRDTLVDHYLPMYTMFPMFFKIW